MSLCIITTLRLSPGILCPIHRPNRRQEEESPDRNKFSCQCNTLMLIEIMQITVAALSETVTKFKALLAQIVLF